MSHNVNLHVCFASKEDVRFCNELLKEITRRLTAQGKHEFESLGDIKPVNEPSEADFIIGAPSHKSFNRADKGKNKEADVPPVPVVMILKNDSWGLEVNAVTQDIRFDVRAIFRASKLFCDPESRDLEEFGQFSEVIKNILRGILRKRGLHEEDFAKCIDWKVKLKDTCRTEFVSLFSTPAMQAMARDFKNAVSSLDDDFLSKLRDSKLDSSSLKRRCEDLKAFFEKYYREKHENEFDSYHVPSMLLLGETGCGKSLLSQIAANVIMTGKKLTRINISSYNQDSIDAMLFGAEEGSYTGSIRDIFGLFIEHCGEVVFLDEIGDMPSDTQNHLLTYMDSAQVFPRGMTNSVCAPCILIAATNKDVKNDPSFRKDILNRFDYVIEIPNLKARRQDLRLLISMILQDDKINPVVNGNRKVQYISLDAIDFFESRDYPGNFRELRFCLSQVVHRAYNEGSKCVCLKHCL